MQEQSVSTVYFSEPGPHNTERALEVALCRAEQLGLGHVIVASDTGTSARAALKRFTPKFNVTVVTNPRGLKLPVSKLHDYLPRFREHKQTLMAKGVQAIPCSLSEQVAAELEQLGARVCRIDWRRFQAYTKSGLRSLDWVGVGLRVGLVISIWAHLAGAVPNDCELLALSGTGFGGGGVDTAIIVQTASSVGGWRVCEILARPRVGPPSEV